MRAWYILKASAFTGPRLWRTPFTVTFHVLGRCETRASRDGPCGLSCDEFLTDSASRPRVGSHTGRPARLPKSLPRRLNPDPGMNHSPGPTPPAGRNWQDAASSSSTLTARSFAPAGPARRPWRPGWDGVRGHRDHRPGLVQRPDRPRHRPRTARPPRHRADRRERRAAQGRLPVASAPSRSAAAAGRSCRGSPRPCGGNGRGRWSGS